MEQRDSGIYEGDNSLGKPIIVYTTLSAFLGLK